MGSNRFLIPYSPKKSGPVTLSTPPSLDGIDYPIFCFRHLHRDYDFESCNRDPRFLKGLVQKIKMLSDLDWDQIRLSNRQKMGSEKISRSSIKPAIPTSLTADVKDFLSFYFASGKARLIGWRNQMVFHVIYIDTNLSVYEH